MFRTRSLVAGAAFALILAPLGVPSSASAAPAAGPRVVHKVGTGSYKVTGTGSGLPASLATEIRQEEGPDAGLAATTAAAPAGAHRRLAPARRSVPVQLWDIRRVAITAGLLAMIAAAVALFSIYLKVAGLL